MSLSYGTMRQEAPDLPGWARETSLVWGVRLSQPTPSSGALERLTASQRAALRRQWRDLLLAQAPPPPEKAFAKVGLVIVRKASRLVNWDNAFGGLKPLMDCLVIRKLQHPDGLGYLFDDHPGSGMPHPPALAQQLVSKADESTLLFLFDLERGDAS